MERQINTVFAYYHSRLFAKFRTCFYQTNLICQVIVDSADFTQSPARTSAGVQFEDRGEQALKGVGEAVRVWAVVEGEA
jgi:hypothetical protein